MFTPSTELVFSAPNQVRFGKEKVLKYRNNPTSAQKKESYWPRLTLQVSPARVTGGLQITLRMEFSAPKVLYGNNFDELIDIQFGDMIRSLCDKLRRMGVIVAPDTLGQAKVSAIHYSKNIVLTDFTRCSMVINELAKLNIWKRLKKVSPCFLTISTHAPPSA